MKRDLFTSTNEWFGDIWQDTRFAIRRLAKARSFTFIAVLSLAVGIGANTALFTILHASFLEPVPGVTGADRIVEALVTRRSRDLGLWSYPDFQDVREAETPIEILAGVKERDGTLTTEDGSQSVRVSYASAGYFRVLGVSPARGRVFLPSDDRVPGNHPVAVISHHMWQNRLGADEDIVGRTILLNRTPYRVVGVAPEEFRGHRSFQVGPDLWVPLMQHPFLSGNRSLLRERGALWLEVLGRLRPDAKPSEASAALNTVFARLEREYPESNEDRSARAAAFGTMPAQGRTASMMGAGALVGFAGLVLLIICGNVAGMVLARGATREREIAVRQALGSGRGCLIRLLMVEALVLAVAGGGLGVTLAVWGLHIGMPASFAAAAPNISFAPNITIIFFSLALTLGTVLAFGLLPALRFSRPDLVSSLKDESGGGGGRRVGRVHRLAASAQAGVALLLLVVCGLSLRALGVMERRDLGFEPQDLLLTRLDLSLEGYASPEEAWAFLERVKEMIESLPGVESAALADGLPLDLIGNFSRAERSDRSDEEGGRVLVEFTRAGEGFFRTAGTPVLQGRGFERSDDASSGPVIVITRSLADRLWPGEEALGRQLSTSARFREEPKDFTVIGVIPNVASSRATEDHPHMYVALRQEYEPRVTILVRAMGDAASIVRPLQMAILSVDPTLPIPEVIFSESLVERSTEGQRIMARGAGGLGLLALLLSAIGLYGVVALTVAGRTREIGLRIALGATKEQVLRAVLRDAVRLAVPGLAVGAVLAIGTGFTMRSMLLGVNPFDPISILSVSALLFLTVLLASLVPAQRASTVDPMVALRSE